MEQKPNTYPGNCSIPSNSTTTKNYAVAFRQGGKKMKIEITDNIIKYYPKNLPANLTGSFLILNDDGTVNWIENRKHDYKKIKILSKGKIYIERKHHGKIPCEKI